MKAAGEQLRRCGDVHVWCCSFDDIRDEPLLEEYRRLLSAEERERRTRFLFARDRHRYLVTRALVRTVLSRYADVAPAEWQFAVNGYGRPAIDERHAAARDISFNLSHTHDLIVLAISHGRPLGIDTENARTRQAAVDVAEKHFAPCEVTALAAVAADRQSRRFFEYWTLKEAYVKARTRGLSIPLDRFSLRFIGAARVAISFEPDQADSPENWHLWQFSLSGDYVTAICAGRCGPAMPHLVVQGIVPLVSERGTEIEHLRTSA